MQSTGRFRDVPYRNRLAQVVAPEIVEPDEQAQLRSASEPYPDGLDQEVRSQVSDA